jgi:transcriptional regulator of acetoin/glycerol metabolism
LKPHGGLLTVLDVYSLQHDVSRQNQLHTITLVNLSAKAIDGSYFLRSYKDEWLLRFHSQAEYIGQVNAVNQAATNLLGLSRRQLPGLSVVEVFDCHLDDVLGRASMQLSTSCLLSTKRCQWFFRHAPWCAETPCPRNRSCNIRDTWVVLGRPCFA